MSFVHFTDLGKAKKSTKEIIIHLEHSVFDAEIYDEVEGIITKALREGTWERTRLVPPSPMGINLKDGSASPMDSSVSTDILVNICNEILSRL
jgi:hypothetical protein